MILLWLILMIVLYVLFYYFDYTDNIKGTNIVCALFVCIYAIFIALIPLLEKH